MNGQADELFSIHGQQMDLKQFSDVARPDQIIKLVRSAIAACGRIPGIDLEIVASIVVRVLPALKDSFRSDRGATFITFASQRVRWEIGHGMRSREVFRQGQLRVPKSERDRTAFVHLDDSAADNFNLHEKIAGSDNSAVGTEVDAKDLLWELADPVSVMLGMLRVIPFSERQRMIEIFESCYGLNGRTKQSFTAVSKRWHLHTSRPRQIIEKAWERLAFALSPIHSHAELADTLARITYLEDVLGEPFSIRPAVLSQIEYEEILARFTARSVERKVRKRENLLQLPLGPFEKAYGLTRQEAMVFAVCQVFGIPLARFRGPDSDKNTSTGRYVAAFLLDSDLKVYFETIGQLIGRSVGMARQGKFKIALEIKEGNRKIIEAISSIRGLYESTISPNQKRTLA